MDADGSNLVRLTFDSLYYDGEPAWSPDGSKIAFDSHRDSEYDIYVMDADGSNPVRLTYDGRYFDREPAWSPDGSKIAFETDRATFCGHCGFPPNEIYVMDADGSNPVRLTDDPEDEGEPAWSPDGSKIVFQGIANSGVTDIWVMDSDGSNRVNLTLTSTSEIRPSWSPVK